MNFSLSGRFRRVLCAVCALVFLFTLASPAALAAGSAEDTADTLTEADAAQMAEADAAVTALVDSSGYAAMSLDERRKAAGAELDELAAEGLVDPSSIRYDEENGLYSFAYSCGVLGGILLADQEEDEEAGLAQLPLAVPEELGVGTENDLVPLGDAIIYYAFDDTANSSRYPYYLYMQQVWNEAGLATYMNTRVTLSDLKHMDRYDLCILSAHGTYYTYTTGWLFKRVQTTPIVLLREESSFWKDLQYGIELLTHQVIKINGSYCITPSFFGLNYLFGQLEDTIVFSETCGFLGGDGLVDTSMADALLAGGAKAVVGFVNNVYAIYSRDLLWSTVNGLIMGESILQAVEGATAEYGEDDVAWYLGAGGRRPHRWASYPLVLGDDTARLYTLVELPAA